jgi:hypothetical protein
MSPPAHLRATKQRLRFKFHNIKHQHQYWKFVQASRLIYNTSPSQISMVALYELIYYVGVPGRGEHVRLILEEGGASYKDLQSLPMDKVRDVVTTNLDGDREIRTTSRLHCSGTRVFSYLRPATSSCTLDPSLDLPGQQLLMLGG